MGREMNAALKELFARVETWPEEAQAEAVRSLEEIENELNAPLSADDLAAVERGMEDVRQGRLFSERHIRDLFDQHRGK